MLRTRRIPRGEKRRDEIAAVAERVFLELGFNDTTMQIVASRAGASKETLYRHFGSKEGLFSEVVRARAERVYGEVESEIGQRNDPRDVLKKLGYNLLGKLLSEDPLCLFRIVISEVQRTPELGRIFFEQGPNQLLKDLASYLEYATKQGMLKCHEPALAAKLFLGSVVANRHIIKLVVPDYEDLTEEIIHHHVEAAVNMFLAAYGPRPDTRGPLTPVLETGHV
jgi:TetR/AcrR family transcriptional regulator, mexJK operon transcriptional repressor